MTLAAGTAWGLDVGADSSWLLDAACRGYPPEWWSLGSHCDDDYKMAHRICQFCPVRTDCLQAGIDSQAWGVIMGGRDFAAQPGRRKTIPATCARPNCANPFDARIVNQKYCSTYCRIKDEKRAKRRNPATVDCMGSQQGALI